MEEPDLEREKIEILRKVVAATNEDADDIFGKQVASELRFITDPAEKMQARRSITRILYDAQDRSMTKTYSQSPASQPVYHTLLLPACKPDAR